jgi:6-pyruvoyltetrahydropterin/6-carboxytetrahydropterin synthase
MTQFSVFVSKADFRFNCAHFIAFKGFRERLHGHNYRLSVKLIGKESLGHDGYVIDFGDIKKATRKLCKAMNEFFLCPMKSDALTITEVDQQICIACEDGSQFSFPKKDCQLMPVMHSSAEELSHYFWCRIIR